MKLNKIFLLSILLFAVVITGCKSTQVINNIEDNGAAKIVISFQQGPGFSPLSPVYTIEVYNNFQMFLSAEKNLAIEGRYMRTLTKEEYKQLINAFVDASFFDFEDEYTSTITDLPTQYISFFYEGKSKVIKDYHGAPNSLGELELMVRSYLDRVGWSKMSW